MDKIINIKVDSEQWYQAKLEALKRRITLQEWLAEAIKDKLSVKV